MATQSSETPNRVGRASKDSIPPRWTQYFRLRQTRGAIPIQQDEFSPGNPENPTAEYRGDYKPALIGLASLAVVFVAWLTLVLVMAFFGDERQSALALRILTIGGQALGGGGFVLMVAYAAKRMLDR